MGGKEGSRRICGKRKTEKATNIALLRHYNVFNYRAKGTRKQNGWR